LLRRVSTSFFGVSFITEKTLNRKKGSVHEQVSGLRKFVDHNLRHIRRLTSGEYGNPAVVRQELAKHIDSITLQPEGNGGSIKYKGNWKLLDDTGGPEGGNRSLSPLLDYGVPFEGVLGKVA
jgi:hypothetical protein